MDNLPETHDKKEKWDFEDYAFTVATVIFLLPIALMLVFPILVQVFAEIFEIAALADWDADDVIRGRFPWFAFSWMAFMFAWLACEIKEAFDARHKPAREFAYQLETAIYVAAMIAMLILSIIGSEWSSSWLASPITWAIFAVVRLSCKRLCENRKREFFRTGIRAVILAAGLAIDLIGSTWFAFPLAWTIVSVLQLYDLARAKELTHDMIDTLYAVFSVIFMGIALIWGIWITSWLAFPLAWLIVKAGRRFLPKKDEPEVVQ